MKIDTNVVRAILQKEWVLSNIIRPLLKRRIITEYSFTNGIDWYRFEISEDGIFRELGYQVGRLKIVYKKGYLKIN